MSGTTKAGRLLSRYIREIASEKVCSTDGSDVGTRAEALARKLWELAEGYVDSDGKTHEPNKAIIALLLDRMEGRVATVDVKDQKSKATIAERVREQSKMRMNALLLKNSKNRQ